MPWHRDVIGACRTGQAPFARAFPRRAAARGNPNRPSLRSGLPPLPPRAGPFGPRGFGPPARAGGPVGLSLGGWRLVPFPSGWLRELLFVFSIAHMFGFCKGFLNFFCGGMRGGFFCFLSLLWLGRPLSPVESGGKPPGRKRTAFPPRTPAPSLFVGHAAATRGGSGCRGLLEFPLKRKQSSANSPHCSFGVERQPLWGLVGAWRGGLWCLAWVEGQRAGVSCCLSLFWLGRRPSSPGRDHAVTGCYGLLRVVKDYIAFLQNLCYTVIVQTNVPPFKRKKRAASASSAAPARGNPAYSAPSP